MQCNKRSDFNRRMGQNIKFASNWTSIEWRRYVFVIFSMKSNKIFFFYSMNFNFHRSYSNFEMPSHHRFDSEIFLVSVVGWCVMNWCCCIMQCIFLNEWKTNILRFSTIWFYFSVMLLDLLGNVRNFSCQGNEFFSWFRRLAWKVLHVSVMTG